MGFLKRLTTLRLVSASGSGKTEGYAENDARGPMTNPYVQNRVSEPGGRGNAGSTGYVAGQVAFATQSNMSPTGVGGNAYLPWVGALTAAPLNTPDGYAAVRRSDGGPGVAPRQGGQPWEQPPSWQVQRPAAFTNVMGGDASGWDAINNGPVPARVPHQFRPALRMNATLHSHGQGDWQGTLSGLNYTNLVLAPANLLGGNSVSRFPRSVRLASGTGATTNGAGTSYVPAVFVPRGVQ